MRACVCLCVPAAFNVMLIQFIFNEETVSSYREAKEISGLLHSGKSIAHLFILLFELFVCLKNKPSGYAAKISVASKSFNSFVHTVCVCVCVRITPEKDYHKSNSNVINLLCVDRKEREEISLQLTVSVFGRGAQAGGRVIRLIKPALGSIRSRFCIRG